MNQVVVLEGDGIGPIVIREALRVLAAVGSDISLIFAPIGLAAVAEHGDALPQTTIDIIRQSKVALFGAATTPLPRVISAQNSAATGEAPVSCILRMRRELGLNMAIRRAKSLGLPGWIQGQPTGPRKPVDITILMQNTEGLYAGLEFPVTPEPMVESLRKMPAFVSVAAGKGEDISLSLRLATQQGCETFARGVVDYAKLRGQNDILFCDKIGVMRATGARLFQALRAEGEKRNVVVAYVNADTLLMRLFKTPHNYGLIATSSLIGDLISEAAAAAAGGVGLGWIANHGENVAVFEPAHGSAPHYAQRNPAIVNPTGAILAAADLLRHIGEAGKGDQIENAVAQVLSQRQVRTYDLLGLNGDSEVGLAGAATTREFSDAVISILKA